MSGAGNYRDGHRRRQRHSSRSRVDLAGCTEIGCATMSGARWSVEQPQRCRRGPSGLRSARTVRHAQPTGAH